MPTIPRISESTPSGRRQLLEALRNRLAAEIDGDAGHRRGCECKCGVPPDARTIPTLAKELREIAKELDDLPEAEGKSDLDQIAEQRDKRRSRAARNSAARRADPAGA